MVLDFFNIIWIYFLSKCLFGFRIDTSKLPFSIVARFIPFYSVDLYYNNELQYDSIHNKTNRRIDLIIPCLCDIIYIEEIKG